MIENYIRDRLNRSGYDEVRSPQLFQHSLFQKSGHWEHYRDHIFECGDMALKPMNCPAHVQIFNAQTISYRQLPMRLAEFGCCHRNEASGALHGIMRLRQFVQDDAHIFCREDQIESEVEAFCRLLQSVYGDFGFHDVSVAISLRPDDRAGDDALWDKAEAVLEEAVQTVGLPYSLQPGHGAFYGPKLEFALRDSHGREWQCGTLQLDFVLPGRLNARFIDESGHHQHPVMIHRAILGSMERFIGILLEHYEGRLPDWLTPVQIMVVGLPGAEAYAEEVRSHLAREWRVGLDGHDDNLMNRIKRHSEALIPYIVVVGQREAESRSIAVRRLGSSKPEVMPLLSFTNPNMHGP